MSQISILKYSDIPDAFWAEQTNILFHSKEWIEVLRKSYNIEFLLAQDPASGNFLLFGIIDNPFEKKLVGLPFSDYAGEDNISCNKAFEIISAVQKEYPSHEIFYKSRFSIDENLRGSIPIKSACYHRIEIKGKNTEALLKLQSSSFKRGARKAVQEGVKIEKVFSKNDIKEFYELYTTLRLEKFNLIPQPFIFFENIYELFLKENRGFILKASFDNIAIGVIIVLEFNDGWYYKFGASHKDYLEKRPNNLLFQEVIKLASEAGSKFIDLGMSGSGENYEGLRRFKKAMGGKKYPLTLVKHPALNPENRQMKDKQILNNLTSLIVTQKPSLNKISSMSEFLYPFFA